MKKNFFRIPPWWIAISLSILVALVLPTLMERLERERQDRTVEICLDLQELKDFSRFENIPLKHILDEVRSAGARSVALYELTYPWERKGDSPVRLGFDLEEIRLVHKYKLRPVLRPENHPRTRAVLESLQTSLPAGSWDCLPAGVEAPGYPEVLETAVPLLEGSVGRIISMEFLKQKGLIDLLRALPQKVVVGHGLERDELKELSGPLEWKRYRRAVRERGCRFLYVRLAPWKTLSQNLTNLGGLTTLLKEDGFFLGEIQSPIPAPLDSQALRFRQALAFLTALVFPLLGLVVWKTTLGRAPQPGVLWALAGFALITAFSLSGALCEAALLSDPAFAARLEVMRGVKVVLLVPWILGAALLVGRKEWVRLSKTPVLWWQAALCVGLVGAALVLVARSGNTGLFQRMLGEQNWRQGLENFFGVRPRTKEFLIGHPLLFLGLFFQGKGNTRAAAGFMALGLIGQISLINTFSHAHTPLDLSLARTGWGLLLGLVIGWGLIGLSRFQESEPVP